MHHITKVKCIANYHHNWLGHLLHWYFTVFLNSPWHLTSGFPQNSSLHSRQVLPPNPALQEHWPIIYSTENKIQINPCALYYDPKHDILVWRWSDLIAGRAEGMVEVAVAGLAAFPAGHIPCVRCALIAVLAHHIRKTLTLTAVQVTVTVTRRGARLLNSAHMITHTLWERPGRNIRNSAARSQMHSYTRCTF